MYLCSGALPRNEVTVLIARRKERWPMLLIYTRIDIARNLCLWKYISDAEIPPVLPPNYDAVTTLKIGADVLYFIFSYRIPVHFVTHVIPLRWMTNAWKTFCMALRVVADPKYWYRSMQVVESCPIVHNFCEGIIMVIVSGFWWTL